MTDRAYRTAPRERFTGGHHRPPIVGMDYRTPRGLGTGLWLAAVLIGTLAVALS